MWTLLFAVLTVLAFAAGQWTRTRSSKSALRDAMKVNKATARSARALVAVAQTISSLKIDRARTRAQLRSIGLQVDHLAELMEKEVLPEVVQGRSKRNTAKPVERVAMPTIDRSLWTQPEADEEAEARIVGRGAVRGPGRPS